MNTTPDRSVRCVNPRCRPNGDPDPVYGRQVICSHCTERVQGQLTDLAYAHHDLEAVLAAGTTARFDKVAGSRTPPVPMRLEVADHRDHIRTLLVSWVRMVVEERDLSEWPANRPHTLADFLITHAEWLAQHPAAGDLCIETSRALGRARTMLEPPGVVVWVPCPDVHREGCIGRIPVVAEGSVVWCSDCGFETDNLPWLGRLLRAGDTPIVTAVDACHRLRAEGIELRPGTIRTWVQRKKVAPRGRDHAGRVLYDVDELRRCARAGQGRGGGKRQEHHIAHVTVKERISAERGRATDHRCADCHEQAHDWTYDYRDPEAQRSADGRLYSTDVRHYEPRCRRCHRKYDTEHSRRTGTAA